MGAQFGACLFFHQGSEHSQLPHKCNSQSGSALESHWAPSLALSPVCDVKHSLLASWALALHT